MEAINVVLTTAFRHRISEPNIEAGFERFRELTGGTIDEGAFRDAIAACVRDELMRDPVRLEEGSLQCHWRLELTSKGVESVRKLARPRSPDSPAP